MSEDKLPVVAMIIIVLLVLGALFFVTIMAMSAFGYKFPGDIDRDNFCKDNGFDGISSFSGVFKCESIEGNTIIRKKFVQRGSDYFFVEEKNGN